MLNHQPNTLLVSLLMLLYLGRTVGAVPTMCVAKVVLLSSEQTPLYALQMWQYAICQCGLMRFTFSFIFISAESVSNPMNIPLAKNM